MFLSGTEVGNVHTACSYYVLCTSTPFLFFPSRLSRQHAQNAECAFSEHCEFPFKMLFCVMLEADT
jgi:hypothetical protein